MDLGNIIYIVAVVAYFIYQATKKKRDQELPDSAGPKPETPKKGMSFEELLKEIRDAQNPIPTPKTPKPTSASPAPVLVEIPRAKPIVRKPTRVEDDEEAKYYEGAYRSSQANPYQSFRETTPAETAPAVKFDYASLETKKVNPYAELLKSPKTLKQAVVVSEILKPKYF